MSFKALPVLAIGGIVCAVCGLVAAVFFSFVINIGRAIAQPYQDKISFTLPMFATSCIISAATGVGLASAVTYIFSGVSATLGGTVAVASAIGFIAPIVGVLALHLLPIIEKAIELCFPQEQDGNNSPQSPLTNEDGKPPSTSVRYNRKKSK